MAPQLDGPKERVSLRAKLAEARFSADEAANVEASKLLGLAISFIVTLFVSFLLFGILGPDANAVCTDTTNYTADECSNATQARLLFWVFLVIIGVVHILIGVGMARDAVK